MDVIDIIELVATFFAVVIVLTMHEWAHAFVAYKCGDPTAKLAGRMTLNPIKHFDPIGLVSLTVLGFGWGKPVPINPYNFKRYKLGCFLTSGAGIFTNLIFAFLITPIVYLVYLYLIPLMEGTYAEYFFTFFFSALSSVSISLAVFNLLPFYPLDGFNLIASLNKKRGKAFVFWRNYSRYFLIALLVIDLLARYINVLGYINILGYLMTFGTLAFSVPINWFWTLIFGL